MSVVVSLKDVVEALDFQNDELKNYLNRKTGEIAAISGEDARYAEREEFDEAKLPAWQRESVLKAREVLESEDFVPLPDRFEIHEWEIMERFAVNQKSRSARSELIDAIHGRGAFRVFKDAVRRLGIEQDWFDFREAAFEDIARDWLDAHGIPYS